jgi:hypothetical protein
MAYLMGTAAWKYGLAKGSRNFSRPHSFCAVAKPRYKRLFPDRELTGLNLPAAEIFTRQGYNFPPEPEKDSPPSEEYSAARGFARRLRGAMRRAKKAPEGALLFNRFLCQGCCFPRIPQKCTAVREVHLLCFPENVPVPSAFR